MKKSALILVAVTAACVTAFAMSRSSSTPASQPAPQGQVTKVKFNRTSSDGKELFAFDMFEPWSNAGARVIVVSSASVTDSGLIGFSRSHTIDTASGDSELQVSGEHYRLTVHPISGAWSGVTAETDLEVQLTAVQ